MHEFAVLDPATGEGPENLTAGVEALSHEQDLVASVDDANDQLSLRCRGLRILYRHVAGRM
ncbi:hypothetical protein ACH4SK_43605 [Streptomyces inhibens]|uniref:hypothetical protein n=1 Tax=Streptomyces inhibens TaxID=2293571 RepID=UPI0037A01A33